MKKVKKFKKCDVLFVLGNLSIGGAEKANIAVANYLSKKDKMNISVVALTNINPKLRSLISKDINLIVFNHNRVSKSIFSFLDLIKTIKPKIIFSVLDYVNIFTIILTKLSLIKTKLIISERIDQVGNHKIVKKFKDKIMKYLMRFLIPLLYERADLIHCVSNGVKRSLHLAFGLNKKKMKVIYNPLHLFPVKKQTKKKINKHKLILLSVARLEKQKNHTTLLKALTFIKDKINFHLYLVGGGSELKNLLALSKKLNLSKHVTFVGRINNPKKFYQMADIFILSSDYEGLPNVLIEALAFGCKIISSDCPSGPREILENGKWGKLVPVRNHIRLANAIKEVYKKNLFKNSNIRAKDFSIKKIGFEYEKMFNEILNN